MSRTSLGALAAVAAALAASAYGLRDTGGPAVERVDLGRFALPTDGV